MSKQYVEKKVIKEKLQSNEVPKMISRSWRDKNRLYPPFLQQRKSKLVKEDDLEVGMEERVENVVLEASKFRLSICIGRNQFPIACANIPYASDENTLEFGESDFLYSSAGCGCDNGIPTICGLHDVSCMEPICGSSLDNEACNITLATEVGGADDVCQDGVSSQDDKSDDASADLSDKPEYRYYTKVCGESIDYVICESTEKVMLSTQAFEDETLGENLDGENDYFDIHNEEYENVDSTLKNEKNSELRSKTEFFQDPFVSHRLTIPYKEIPPSRYCVGGGYVNDSSKSIFLAKRPQSPVRNIPEDRYDVYEGISEVSRRSELHSVKYTLRNSKEWIDRMIISNSTSSPTTSRETSVELVTTFLKVLLDDVRLSLTISENENDVSLTLATVWAFTEFVMAEVGFELMQSFTISNLGAVPKFKRSLSHNLTPLKSTSLKKDSSISYPPRGSDNHSLHRAIPWIYMCGAHAEGLPKNYATIRDFIDKFTPDNESKSPRAGYLPDVNCTHLDEMMPEKSCNALEK